jgi:hypothetical protein
MSWILICWIVIGVFNYGMTFGHFQNTFPSLADFCYKEDMVHSILFSLFGPIMLIGFPILNILDSRYKYRLKDIKFY